MYLAALHHKQISLGLPDPNHAAMPKLKMVKAGIARAKAKTPKDHQRLPITPHILRQIRNLWYTQATDPDIIMLWAACTMAFFGFFRLGELITPSDTVFDPATHLTLKDVTIDQRENPSLVQVRLKVSKTDQERRGVSVLIGTKDDLCPVAAVTAYMAIRGNAQGPFFRFADAWPLTQDRFITKVRRALERCGHDPASYACHSFRIGAATTAAEKGIEDSTIKPLGRWQS